MLVLGMFCVGYVMLADPSGAPSDLTNSRTAAGRKFRKLSPGTPNFALWGQMLGGDQNIFADLANKGPATSGDSNNKNDGSRDLFGISFLASPENGPDCRVPPALPPPQPIAPTFAASYPGSGAKMSWNLITGLTGVQTGDDWLLNDVEWNQAVTVKTHYPHPEGNPDIGNLFTSKNLKGAFPRAGEQCLSLQTQSLSLYIGSLTYTGEGNRNWKNFLFATFVNILTPIILIISFPRSLILVRYSHHPSTSLTCHTWLP